MTQDTKQIEEADEQWWRDRFKGYSKEELDEVTRQDRERKADEALVDEHVKAATEDPNCHAFDKQKIMEIEQEKQKKLKKIYED